MLFLKNLNFFCKSPEDDGEIVYFLDEKTSICVFSIISERKADEKTDFAAIISAIAVENNLTTFQLKEIWFCQLFLNEDESTRQHLRVVYFDINVVEGYSILEALKKRKLYYKAFSDFNFFSIKKDDEIMIKFFKDFLSNPNPKVNL